MDPVDIRRETVTTVVPASPGTPTAVPAATQVHPATPIAPVVRTTLATQSTGVRTYPTAYRAIQSVWLVVGIIAAILALDFMFRLLAAHPVGFAAFIYALGRAFAAPFDGIFNAVVSDGVYVVRWSDLLAMGIYPLVGWGVTKAIRIGASTGPRPIEG